MFVVISYDIPDDKRRNKVCKLLENHGTHIQESVFEFNLSPKERDRLRTRLERIIKTPEDNVRVYYLCEACVAGIQVLGAKPVTKDPDFYVV